MAWHNLLSKNDRAIVAYLCGLGVSAPDNTYPAKRSDGKDIDCVVIWSHDAAPEGNPYTGTYLINVRVMVKTLAVDSEAQENDDVRIASENRVASVFDAFHQNIDSAGDKLADAITAAARELAANDAKNADLADYTALNVAVKGVESGVEEGTNAWIDTLTLEVLAAPSNIS